jgi:hypothetical protein
MKAGTGTERRGRKGFAEGAKEIQKKFSLSLSSLRPLRSFCISSAFCPRIQEFAL